MCHLATDGMLVKTDPEDVDFIIIHSGERYMTFSSIPPGNPLVITG